MDIALIILVIVIIVFTGLFVIEAVLTDASNDRMRAKYPAKYCIKCGTQLVPYKKKQYSETTGKVIKSELRYHLCNNEGCGYG